MMISCWLIKSHDQKQAKQLQRKNYKNFNLTLWQLDMGGKNQHVFQQLESILPLKMFTSDTERTLPAHPAIGHLAQMLATTWRCGAHSPPDTERPSDNGGSHCKAAAEVPDEELSWICRGLATTRSLTQSTTDFYLEPKTLAFPSFVSGHSTTSWFYMIWLAATATGTRQTNLQNAPISATLLRSTNKGLL